MLPDLQSSPPTPPPRVSNMQHAVHTPITLSLYTHHLHSIAASNDQKRRGKGVAFGRRASALEILITHASESEIEIMEREREGEANNNNKQTNINIPGIGGLWLYCDYIRKDI